MPDFGHFDYMGISKKIIFSLSNTDACPWGMRASAFGGNRIIQ